ncbi:MAG: NAD(+) diphosphatase [Gammaproteobacteria bacterium]|nr:NAD(+) diphosphatase [Gammaproteobacteria bacterium]
MSPAERPYNPFSAAFLDRRSASRLQPDWAREARTADTLFIIGRGPTQLIYRRPHTAIAFLAADHPLVAGAADSELVLLGWHLGRRCVLVETRSEPPELPPDMAFEELRPLLAALRTEEAGLLACARALSIWHARHRYCGVCGAPTLPVSAGHVMRCSSSQCGQDFFPRIDPAIIVLVTAGEYALLGRQRSWPPGRYSTLAGFVEPGESLEDAVAREVLEETGVPIQHAQYFASQSWPFPSSLMLGFHAHAERVAVRLDHELEDARWFSAGEIERLPGLLPPRFAIARRLVETWFEAIVGRPLPYEL